MKPEEIKEIQNIDTLSEAELLTGKSYKEDLETSYLGIALMQQKIKKMNEIMENTDDTKSSETTKEYLRKVMNFGFELLLREKVIDCDTDDEIFILWHKEYSILLVFDTYNGNRNGGHFYYNWSPFNSYIKTSTESGGYIGFNFKEDFSEQIEYPLKNEKPNYDKISDWKEYCKKIDDFNKKENEWRLENKLRSVWVGNHDCREAIKNNISLLLKEGEFLKKWKSKPFMWLVSHSNYEKHNYEIVTNERLNKLPDYVKECIGITSNESML